MREFYLANRLSLPFYSNCILAFKENQTPSKHPGVCRQPGFEKDTLIETPHSQHIAVCCCGQIYIARPDVSLEAIIKNAHETPAEPEVAWLTSLPRASWAYWHRTLSPENLHLIQTARFWVALDTESNPKGLSELANLLLQGNFKNRWFDHSKQFIFFANGQAGLNFEHSTVDGEPAAHLIQDLKPNLSPTNQNFEKLHWANTPNLKIAIEEAQFYTRTELKNREIICTETRPFNSDFEVQCAIQKAVTQIFGKATRTSEAVSLSHLPEGRYNTIFFESPEDVLQTHRQKIHVAKEGHEFEILPCQISTSSGGAFPKISLFGFTDTGRDMIGIAYMRKQEKTIFCVKADGQYREAAQALTKSLEQQNSAT